ncbi:polyketide cyclase [Lapillicoccus jejuensis]|uniref:Polyketide cyclase/dehydrase/lipid transport protein n=1 Tax=Lapillicoccus jejuensis TaxID=402171 RepID=A0A542DZC2_9MICO|nr:polyketide cyclase [Lapillicoccus jejuensis]TQJ08437.1 hypothetical protein FB458_1525 [Lapillicoccus jejuensis]
MIGDRWGVSDAEVAAPYPCDDLVTRPALQAWRGVDVAAPPERVWPWVAQLRVAPYSYDWVDNGGRRSPRRLLDLPEPKVGDPFTSTRGRPIGRLLAVEPGRSLTGEVLGAVMTYVVAPVPGRPGRSRLLLKVVMETSRPVAVLVTLGDLVMARKQLLTWRDLAEGR